MAEGRWLPWKEQKVDIRPTPDYKELAKPLKKPPHGLEWHRLDNGAWELRSSRKVLSPQEQKEEDRRREEEDKNANKEEGIQDKNGAPEFLEHVVVPDDTLMGICLKYKVKDRELRRLNGFVGDHFRMCDSLIVPNRFAAGQQPIQAAIGKQPMTRDDMMQVFRKASRLGTEETRFYLETNGWELAKALAEWRAENRWEADQARRTGLLTLRHRPQQDGGSSSINRGSGGRFAVVSGTTAGGYNRFSGENDRDVEHNNADELADARVPLLADSYITSGVAVL